MNNAEEKERRILAVSDFLKLSNQMSDISFFYLTEDRENQGYIPEPTCPLIIRRRIEAFLGGAALNQIECGAAVHYIIDFGIHFLVFHLPCHEGYAVMGPLRYRRPLKEEIAGYVSKYKLDKNYHYILSSFLNSITKEHASAEPFRYIIRHIYKIDMEGNGELKRIIMEEMPKENLSVDPPVMHDMRSIDEKYEREQELRELVAQGKRREAGMVLEQKDKTRYFRHASLNSMLRLLSSNILYKQALAQNGIPPAYIEQVYTSYIRKIAGNIDEIQKNESLYSGKMLDDYCKLARDYATQNVSRTVRKIMNYILLNYTEKITVNSIALYLDMTPNYVSSVFKREMGISLIHYLNKVRINSSLILLENTDMPVSEIAQKVGIEDYNYFSRIFKKKMNQSPAGYRKAKKSC